MNTSSPLLDANINLAQRESNSSFLTVHEINMCAGCGNKPATTLVAGRYPRCQPCANKVVSVWSEMRSAKSKALANCGCVYHAEQGIQCPHDKEL